MHMNILFWYECSLRWRILYCWGIQDFVAVCHKNQKSHCWIHLSQHEHHTNRMLARLAVNRIVSLTICKLKLCIELKNTSITFDIFTTIMNAYRWIMHKNNKYSVRLAACIYPLNENRFIYYYSNLHSSSFYLFGCKRHFRKTKFMLDISIALISLPSCIPSELL